MMPELPEIECLRRTLEPFLIGSVVEDVKLHRRDVVRTAPRSIRTALLSNQCIVRLARHGKQLAIISESGNTVCIHLGMSGQCWVSDPDKTSSGEDNEPQLLHIHCRWRIRTVHDERELLFRDPRRFGGIWTFQSFEQLLTERWANIGPDALSVTSKQLRTRLEHAQRSIKAALLDQRAVAGIGNIYADEALFAAGIHPLTCACSLSPSEFTNLARSIKKILRRAIACGGSTLRDYRDGNGRAGSFQSRHTVYGRAGMPCIRCEGTLEGVIIGQRSTTFCPNCQDHRASQIAAITVP